MCLYKSIALSAEEHNYFQYILCTLKSMICAKIKTFFSIEYLCKDQINAKSHLLNCDVSTLIAIGVVSAYSSESNRHDISISVAIVCGALALSCIKPTLNPPEPRGRDENKRFVRQAAIIGK